MFPLLQTFTPKLTLVRYRKRVALGAARLRVGIFTGAVNHDLQRLDESQVLAVVVLRLLGLERRHDSTESVKPRLRLLDA